jgi:hypothetical protein
LHSIHQTLASGDFPKAQMQGEYRCSLEASAEAEQVFDKTRELRRAGGNTQ